MSALAIVAALAAAGIHAWFFALESIWFMRPAVFARFGLVSDGDARIVRSFAYNQGFYNLFLAAGAVIGVAAALTGSVDAGRAVTLFACASMVAAAIVLATHDRRFLRPALLQASMPALAIVGLVFLR